MILMKPEDLWADMQKIRMNGPLVHNITNYVVMNSTANALLAIGASPVMAHAAEEVEEMTGLASALVINTGTLSTPWIAAMSLAMAAAAAKGIPVILDPVGAGATKFRTATAERLISEGRPTIIRGNASEIMALCASETRTKGVDSLHSADEAVRAGREVLARSGAVISISGPSDIILGQDGSAVIRNGHPMMPKVTGLGCTATALTGAFAAVNASPFRAAAEAMAVMGMAGEIAAQKAGGPGTFQDLFLDALYNMSLANVKEMLRAEYHES